MTNFPTAHSTIYRNEDGEVLGWDNESSFEPEYCEVCGFNHSGPCPEDEEPEEPTEEECIASGKHGDDATQVEGDTWECDRCFGQFSYSDRLLKKIRG